MFIIEVKGEFALMYIHPVSLEKESEIEQKANPNPEGSWWFNAEFELADTLVIFESLRIIKE